ncbi:MAG: hypothetical protein IPI77_16395 [Saprospiraceae bacterium]|nr:hypothetical protein [Saprospiraceae bacterium]
MDIAFQITEMSGPRVTNSAGFMRAANYAKNQFTQWGLVNSRLDPWGDFGKGWDLKKSYVAILSPWYRSLIAYPKAWSSGTNGPQTGGVLLISAKDSSELNAYRGKLKGMVLIVDDLIHYEPDFKPNPERRTDEELQKLSEVKEAEDMATLRRRMERNRAQNGISREVLIALKRMAIKEDAIALLSSAADNNGGTVFVLQAGPFKISDPANFWTLLSA